MRKIILITVILLLSVMIGCGQKPVIPTPSKIVIWNSGQSKVLTSTDKNFDELVDLTNARIEKNRLSTAQDMVDDEYVNSLKKESIALEFIYDTEQKMSVSGDGFQSFKYHRLFFSLLNEKSGQRPSSFQHGDLNNYIEYSRGPLIESQHLIDLAKNSSK